MKIALIGATGLVGRKILQVLEEQQLPLDSLILVASERSLGKEIWFKNRPIKVVSMQTAIDEKPDIAIFSAGAAVSLHHAPLFAEKGTRVIDNSSAWRKNQEIPLIIPEINADVLKKSDRIIANPNCSTIGMLMAIAPLHRAIGIKRLVVSTYQSVSGSCTKGIEQFRKEQKGEISLNPAYPHTIYGNVIPQGGDFCDNGYTTEEEKLVFETRKILRAPQIAITATVVRVPVLVAHSLAVNIEFECAFDIEQIHELLHSMPGLVVCDDIANKQYPMPLTAADKDAVFVGRIRRDYSIENGLNMWVVADNLRKGAATNAVQIAKLLIDDVFFDR
ncbi:MAG: aspartate-semialdehyde dehydrogenase [Lentimicrobiaceae bacterium]|jgi:aspartate-semialdehyde dehydrogenase|nr:aspartate-semialdehyde dehydrogenase [Lentimicrobiaceae bacterium]